MKYYKRFWNETTGEPLSDSWGTSTYFFETENNEVLKQLQVFENGQVLKYNISFIEDEFGRLAEELDFEEFINFEISSEEFNESWDKLARNTF